MDRQLSMKLGIDEPGIDTGYTRAYDRTETVFYLNRVEITCRISYETCGIPHLEFTGKPSLLTHTGYYSHFTMTDISKFESVEELIEQFLKFKIGKKYRAYMLQFPGRKEDAGNRETKEESPGITK